ncbi:hypothetical protein GA0116948_11079 [Chitinophaga costaii]|uniref:SWIM-type domain-containing protein n=1 Tax=Chitinophaga costaii TaxID=1335309 RepID=A0A1C4EX25_9BACT|nr:hypothetical protein [Chitinophaga costaii]SCC48135.1 hypothetical protein GA0116948_11079 [Chitinophaga costaii]
MLPTIRITKALALPDNDQWQFRFNVESASSNRLYTISQHKVKKHWGCSCPGWKAHRTCKHLQALSLPCFERPFEPTIIIE